jgi:protein arginine kinase activator
MEFLKCSICKKPAVVHIEQMINGVQRVIHLCETCARNYGVLPNNVLPFSVAKNIGAALFGDLDPSQKSSRCCDNCGYTLELFKETGQLGCAHCYEGLKKKLLPLIENMQKGVRHIGKRPKGFILRTNDVSQRKVLEGKLRQAIEGEHFEEAAKIRDQLRSFHGGNGVD